MAEEAQDLSTKGPDAKKSRLEENMAGNGDNNVASSTNGAATEWRFAKFTMKRVLNESSHTKMMCVEGRFEGSDDPAVVIMNKTPFSEEKAKAMLSGETGTKVDIQNDIYSTLQLMPQPQYNTVKTSLVYPATQKHIDKYSAQEMFIAEESPEDYKNITLPFIESEQFSIQWVYNILEKKTESERIVYEDADPETGFILLPDMKWDCKQVEDLYLVAIVHKHGIKSLRDLTTGHLQLLKNIHDKGITAIQEKFSVPKSKLRIYLHYQPSYYHLHVHFTHLKYDAPGSGVERAHLLADVINNIELDPEYYQKKTLSFTMKANQGLCKKYKEAGRTTLRYS